MTYAAVTQAARAMHLKPLGGFHEGNGTTVLLGPHEPDFWANVSTHPEFTNAATDPLDHWSTWAITTLAEDVGAKALFPFGGPPFQPFISWALKSGETWQSPVGLLVHKDAGLMVSYRGALRFDHHVTLPAPSTSPCKTCTTKPCLTACPVDAIGAQGYDVPRCLAHIKIDSVCAAGCRVRLACPISQSYGRAPEQTAFHMKAFQSE